MRKKDEQKYDAISQAAVQLINSVGFAETSVSKIAKAAGVSPATIYVYFKNKEDLLNHIYLDAKRELRDALLNGVDDSLSIEAAFKLIWTNLFIFALENASQFAFIEQFANSPLINKISREEIYGYYQPLYALVERGKESGAIKDIPNEVLEAFSFYPMLQLAKNHISGQYELTEERISQVLELAWDAISP